MPGILEALGGFSNPYGAPSRDEWAINSASFQLLDGSDEKLVFFASKSSEDPSGNKTGLENVTDSGGRRLAIYEYPYRDGQVTEDLGRRGEKYVFIVKFFGSRYRDRYVDFYRKVINRRSIGILTHPTIGDVHARLETYEFIHKHDEFNAVALRCTFVEDTTDSTRDNQPKNDRIGAIDSLLRTALSVLTTVQRTVQTNIFSFQAILLLPQAVVNAMQLRLQSVINQHASLLAQMAATFGTDGSIIDLASSSGGVTGANSGTSTSGSQLPPIFQVGLPPSESAAVSSNQSTFINANQVTATQLIFNTNQSRAEVAEAIAFHESQLGSDAFEAVIAYRQLVVAFQKAAESCIKSTAIQTTQYLIPFDMTLAEVAFANGLDPDRMVDIERLNPDLGSANLVEAGSVLLIPSA